MIEVAVSIVANFGEMKIELWMDLERLVGIVVDLTDKLVYNNSL